MNSESDYYYDHDDDCYPVQLEGSHMTPRAAKVRLLLLLFQNILSYRLGAAQTILRQRFNMRRYNLEKDGGLTNQLKTME
jgi:hypothetical protein